MVERRQMTMGQLSQFISADLTQYWMFVNHFKPTTNEVDLGKIFKQRTF